MGLIIDTDCGIDDISAILVALGSPVEMVAMTIVEGNVDISEGVSNAQRLVRLADRNIPIFKGSSPLIEGVYFPERWPGHGQDGLGGFTSKQEYKLLESELFPSYESVPVSSEPAAMALVRLVNAQPNELDLVALGPLTNLALAIKLDPQFLTKLKSCYIMGGCIHAKGNANNTAEFNIHYDPEAAHIVFQAAVYASFLRDQPVLNLVPWETTLDNAFDWSFIDQLKETTRGKFVDYIVEFARTQSGSSQQQPGYPKSEFDVHVGKLRKCVLPDVSAMIAFLYPDTVVSYHDWDIKVELSGFHTRGTTHMQWMNIKDVNTRVILKMDHGKVYEIMKKSLQ
jgi:inosine-uridine nucleoside N-ribohydrolase